MLLAASKKSTGTSLFQQVLKKVSTRDYPNMSGRLSGGLREIKNGFEVFYFCCLKTMPEPNHKRLPVLEAFMNNQIQDEREEPIGAGRRSLLMIYLLMSGTNFLTIWRRPLYLFEEAAPIDEGEEPFEEKEKELFDDPFETTLRAVPMTQPSGTPGTNAQIIKPILQAEIHDEGILIRGSFSHDVFLDILYKVSRLDLWRSEETEEEASIESTLRAEPTTQTSGTPGTNVQIIKPALQAEIYDKGILIRARSAIPTS
jgi:hypothetical protein